MRRCPPFEHRGSRSFGFLDQDRVVDVGSRLKSRYSDLRAVLDAGDGCRNCWLWARSLTDRSMTLRFCQSSRTPRRFLCWPQLRQPSHGNEAAQDRASFDLYAICRYAGWA